MSLYTIEVCWQIEFVTKLSETAELWLYLNHFFSYLHTKTIFATTFLCSVKKMCSVFKTLRNYRESWDMVCWHPWYRVKENVVFFTTNGLNLIKVQSIFLSIISVNGKTKLMTPLFFFVFFDCKPELLKHFETGLDFILFSILHVRFCCQT